MARPKPNIDNPPLVAAPPKIELRAKVQFAVQFCAYDEGGDPAPVFRDEKGTQLSEGGFAVMGGLSEQSFAKAREAILKQYNDILKGINSPEPPTPAPAE